MRALLIAVCVLSGCAGPPADSARAACQQKALDDPAVKEAIIRANSPLQEVRIPGVQAQKYAIARAVQRCLAAAEGQVPRGGVEPVQLQ